MHGARALDSAETCTWLHARLDAQTLIDSGDAFAAIAHGAAGETERDLASREYGNAWLAYHLVTTSPGMTADYRSAATAKERALEKRFPGVAGHGDGAIGAPNLTDRVWLYGDGSRAAIFNSIAGGRAGACPAWIGRLSAGEIRALAVFVHAAAHA